MELVTKVTCETRATPTFLLCAVEPYLPMSTLDPRAKCLRDQSFCDLPASFKEVDSGWQHPFVMFKQLPSKERRLQKLLNETVSIETIVSAWV